jgi:hypothetical protein
MTWQMCQIKRTQPWAGCPLFVAGGFEPERHGTIEQCVLSELSEEAHLCGGDLVQLTPEGSPGICEVKWCVNRFTPFMVIGPQSAEHPGNRDVEELIQVRERLTGVPVPLHLCPSLSCPVRGARALFRLCCCVPVKQA